MNHRLVVAALAEHAAAARHLLSLFENAGGEEDEILARFDAAERVAENVQRFVHRSAAVHHLLVIDGLHDQTIAGDRAEAKGAGVVDGAFELLLVGGEIAVDLETNVMTNDGDVIAFAHLMCDEVSRCFPRQRHFVEELRVGRFVEEEDEVAIFANALDLKRRFRLRRVEQFAIGEVFDGLDRLWHAVLAHDEVILVETEDLMAAGVGHDRIDEDEIDFEVLAEFRRLLRDERQREQCERDCKSFHV